MYKSIESEKGRARGGQVVTTLGPFSDESEREGNGVNSLALSKGKNQRKVKSEK